MNADEKQRLIHRVKCPSNSDDLSDAVWFISQSGDHQAIAQMLAALQELEDYSLAYVSDMMADGLFKASDKALSPIIDYVRKNGPSQVWKTCVYVLGEIAYWQGLKRDSRILPVLLEVGQCLLAQQSTRVLAPVIGAICECARGAPVPEAEQFSRRVLSTAEDETDEVIYSFAVENALEILYINNGARFIEELRSKLATVSLNSLFISTIRDFLLAKEDENTCLEQ